MKLFHSLLLVICTLPILLFSLAAIMAHFGPLKDKTILGGEDGPTSLFINIKFLGFDSSVPPLWIPVGLIASLLLLFFFFFQLTRYWTSNS